ncbi:MAG: LacI family DNA-binding transcriptional regulator [Clostridia bacterium]|nr:LacI family DNA-binding transcriptional regulator [Clostridia bacterium]
MANSTMSDVAKEAGVALTTVGRVINGGYVSDEKRERVLAAIQKLGYVPNKMARSLKGGESKLIGVFMRFNTNQVFVSIANGISKAVEAAGYNTFVVTSYRRDVSQDIDEFISRKVDALMIISIWDIDVALIEKVQNAGIPVVMIERCLEIPKVDGVYINDRDGAKTAVKGMIRKGAVKPAFVGLPISALPHTYVERERYEGYLAALDEMNIEVNESRICFTDGYGLEDGRMAAEKLISGGVDFDSVFCTSDILAAGLMQYLYEKNIRVPDDVMIAGYDDTIARMLSPQISSVTLDTDRIGVEAVSMALSRIKAPELPRREVRVDTVYVDR